MLGKDILREEYGGALSTELVVVIAVIAVLLVVAVSALVSGISTYFNTWAGFFSQAGSS